MPKDCENSYDSYVMMISQCEDRDNLQSYLESRNIQSLVYYGTPLHLHEAAKSLDCKEGDFVNSNFSSKCSRFNDLRRENNIEYDNRLAVRYQYGIPPPSVKFKRTNSFLNDLEFLIPVDEKYQLQKIGQFGYMNILLIFLICKTH